MNKSFLSGVFVVVLGIIVFVAGTKYSEPPQVPQEHFDAPTQKVEQQAAIVVESPLPSPSTDILETVPLIVPASEEIVPLQNTSRVEFRTSNDFEIPEVTVTGSGKVPPGEVVIMTAAVKPTENLKKATFSWAVFDSKLGRRERVAAFPDNTQIIFGAGLRPTKFLVTFQASFIFEKTEVVEVVKSVDPPVTEKVTVVTRSDMLTTGITEYVVQVEGDTPEPEPEPEPDNPEPTPAPVFPDGQFGLSKVFYESVTTNVKSRKLVQEIAQNFSSVASAIAAGTIKTPEDVLSKVAEANRGVLVSSEQSVKDEWAKVLGNNSTYQNTLFTLYDGGKLKTVEDFRVALVEIRDGIKAVK